MIALYTRYPIVARRAWPLGRVRRASKGILHTSDCPMPYLGPYHLPLFKGSPQMLSTGSNRFERWQGNLDIIAFAFLFDAIILHMQNKNSFSCHHDVIRFCQYFSNQSGWLGEVSLHEQCRVDFTKMHPQSAPKSMFSCRSILFHL